MEDVERFFRQIRKARNDIKIDRKNFWSKNRINFKNNIKTLVSFFKFPDGWTVNVIASSFLLDKPSMPYDKDIWSFSDVVAATENQGHDIILFFNKGDLEFLSTPALLPIIVHEVRHIYQAAENPKKYVQATVNDELSREYETGADAEVRKYSDEFRRENVLEKIMFCYDERGWNGAKKMADYLHMEAQNSFGGGYDQSMSKEEYEIFAKALEERDIDLFVDYFIKGFETEESKKDGAEIKKFVRESKIKKFIKNMVAKKQQ